jgi:transposase
MSISKSDQKLIQELYEEIKALRAENEALRKENESLRKQVKDVEEKLNTNSRNSSKSPSQDPNRSRKSKKKPSGKNQGAQKGHQGHTRHTASSEKITEFKDIHPSECPHCGGDEFFLDPIHTEKRQVTELPEIQPQVTQYNIHTNKCACCGHTVKADIPREAESAFGPRLKGFISLLSGDLGLTKRKVVSLSSYLNIKVSVGSVCNIHHLAGKLLEKPYQEIKRYTLEQAAIHADETSWYRKGKRQWLWVVTGANG